MSIEIEIKNRHALEDKIKGLFSILECMTDREIETTLGRIADMHMHNPAIAQHVFRGKAINLYFNMRKCGIKKFASITRKVSFLFTMSDAYRNLIPRNNYLESETDLIIRSAANYNLPIENLAIGGDTTAAMAAAEEILAKFNLIR